jgi:prevent-host-death family protein
MKTYTYSQARQKLANLLEESKEEEIIIRRRGGDVFSITPKKSRSRSPFDVPGLKKEISRQDILDAIRDSRERI